MVASRLERALVGAVELSNETLRVYAPERGERQRSFASSLLLAVVAFETAAAAAPGDPRRDTALLIAATLGREAADALRSHGLDERLLQCALACEAAAHACEEAADPDA